MTLLASLLSPPSQHVTGADDTPTPPAPALLNTENSEVGREATGGSSPRPDWLVSSKPRSDWSGVAAVGSGGWGNGRGGGNPMGSESEGNIGLW